MVTLITFALCEKEESVGVKGADVSMGSVTGGESLNNCAISDECRPICSLNVPIACSFEW